MTRACAIALHLVNWKGVFFERYLLDRHVTALEGANGAGKTTVMIAAYVVLLPDLQRLKFVNLGETGATGGDRGIWGRLGEQGPSYAALEIELAPGERVVCGVHLERKAAPSLALTPFLISKLPEGLSPDQFLLSHSGAHEEVPQLDDLASNVKAHGAAIEVFGSAKDYFSRLFELGISPLRLSTDEERNKFNDMLRTSMTGGISRTLTSDLRSFLFKQETGLFDTLSRMRQNLDACRRTRLEVSESRSLELELNGIYTAGHAMFQAALGAARAERSERQRTLENAERAHAQASEHCLELETRASEVQLQKDSLEPRLGRARAAENAAREQRSRILRVQAATERVDTAQAARLRAEPPAALALERKAEASALRASSKVDRDAAQGTLLRAAAGLANLQAGLEELHRQSHAFGRVREQLARARVLLSEFSGHPGSTERELAALLEADTVPSQTTVQRALSAVDELRGTLDQERAERHRLAAGAERLHADYAAARAALALLSGAPSWDDPGAHARAELGRLNELDVLATRAGELEREWQRLRALAQRQLALGAELRALGFDPLPSARDFATGLHAIEQRCREAEAAQREHELGAERQTERASQSEARLGGLEARRERYQRLSEVAARLGAQGVTCPRSPSELGAQLRALDEKRRQLLDTSALRERERQEALRLALEYEASTAGPERELVALAERLDGQLLSTRYEDLDVDAARRTQAELGPLNAAISVDDPYRALSVLRAEPATEESVWLVRSGAWPVLEGPPPVDDLPGHVVVDLGYGLRVTRLPRNVHLGRAARQRRALELRSEAESKEREVESASTELREADAARAALEQLWEHWETWSSGDPKAELGKAREEIDSARALCTAEQRRARELRLELARLRAEADAQRPLLGEHHLLDAPDHSAESEAAHTALERARGARAELARVREARSVLLTGLHLLDGAPPAALDLEAWQRAEPLANARRDRLFAAAEALRVLDAEHTAWAWSEAERALLERTRLVPELEAQHERARLEVTRTEQQFARAEADWETATTEAQRLAAELAAADAHLARARAELTTEPVDDASSAGLEQTELELARQTELLERLRAEERGSNAAEALCRERLDAARKAERARQSELDSERRLSEPAESGWAALSEAARAASVFEEAPPARADQAGSESARLWLEAQAKRALLVDRLHAARGADELERAAAEPWDTPGAVAQSAPALGQRYLELWLGVRAWLAKRLPTSLGDTSEPHLGLSRLQADLGQLERRLERQEGNLRGTSGDVARSIDVQVRRAAAQVRRLNASLAGVGFGSIHGIRVQMDRVAKMDQVLRALREGETQELLFQSNLPIEDALDEIFRRHAGGRSGGQRLIDYREYLELCVAIQRRPDSDWERVNPSQVSTGEAIGIGAALMMVILAEWERDDQLLRRQRTLGSLRFLFLDEANRLSQDNLGVLFDLCRTLDLQLLIAAPEVARAEGNTTYRLVRRVNSAGREEVLVTGRRSSLPATPRIPDPPQAPPTPVQATLFAP